MASKSQRKGRESCERTDCEGEGPERSLGDHPEVVGAGDVHHEEEADEVAVICMADAIVDPRTLRKSGDVSEALRL